MNEQWPRGKHEDLDLGTEVRTCSDPLDTIVLTWNSDKSNL